MTASRTFRRLIPFAAVVLVIVVPIPATIAMWLHNNSPTSRDHNVDLVVAEPVRVRAAPQDTLAAAAAALSVQQPPDADGHFHFVAYEQWARDGSGISPRQTRLWLAPDGSGAEHLAVLPTVGTKQFKRAMTGNTSFTSARRHDQTYTSGQRTPYLASPSADPAELAVQLRSIEPASNGTPGVLRAIAAIYTDSCPGTAVRVAVLRLLASIEGLSINDHAIDDAGRAAYAVGFTTTSGSDTLYLDPATGLMLGLHQTYVPEGGTPQLHQHLVIQQCGRTGTPGVIP